jgi:V8-like Glu-specific endopeptidase
VSRPLGALLGSLALLALAIPAATASELDERHVVPPGTLPAVGQLNGNGGRCTGFLAGSDRLIVTAAHCVFKHSDSTPSQDSFEFQPGFRDGSSTGVFHARVIANGSYHFPTDAADAVQVAAQDWAILLIDKPTGIAPLPLMAMITGPDLVDKSMVYVGYSADMQNGRVPVEDSACRVIRADDTRLDHDCRGANDAAGGPLFLRNGDGTRGPVVGVVTAPAISSPSERLVIAAMRNLASLRAFPEIDFGGRAVFVGAFLNATKVMASTR